MKLKRVVVTGMGALTPIGNNVNDFWDNLVKGKSGVAEITKFALHLLKQDLPVRLKDSTIQSIWSDLRPEKLIFSHNMRLRLLMNVFMILMLI